MKVFPGKFDPETRTVPVTFKHDGIVHRRTINAVVDADGNYDRSATKIIIEQQALGVAEKIRLGVIS